MKKWERHYLHQKAIRNTHCKSLGMSIPQDKTYGVLERVPLLLTYFKAKDFWEIFKATGHSTIEFQTCICFKEDDDDE